MPARTFPNVGLKGGYDQHEGGWGDDQNLNLLKLSALVQGTIISKLSSTPGAPTPPAVYIFDETHPTNPNAVAIFEGPTGEETWTYVDPEAGWLFYNQQDEVYEKFDGTVWVELVLGVAEPDPYVVPFGFTTTPLGGETLLIHVFTETISFPDDWADSKGYVGINPTTNPVALDIRKNGVTVGSISITSAGVITFATTGTTVTFDAGDRITVLAPATADATFANSAFTLRGVRA